MPTLEDHRRGPDLYGISHHELSPADEASIGFAITNPNAGNRQELSSRMPGHSLSNPRTFGSSSRNDSLPIPTR